MLRYRSNDDVKLIVDDSDPSITYSGNWGANSSYAAHLHAYGSTIHYTWQPNDNASISFYGATFFCFLSDQSVTLSTLGSYITVLGILPTSYDLENVGVSTAPSLSSYQIDDGSPAFLSASFTTTPFTNQVFFQPNTVLSDGYHTLVITCSIGVLALDYFTVVPANSGSRPNQNIQKIDDTSPNIIYNNAELLTNTSQADFNSTLHSLSSSQSTASLDFIGNFVAVYGALPAGNSLPDVSFTLDNVGQPIPTNASDKPGSTPPLPATRRQRLSQVLFWKSSMLNNDQHNLSITVKDGEFLLDFILIQTLGDTGPRLAPSSSSLRPYVAPPSSTNNGSSYSSATSSVSASGSPPAGTPSDHTGITGVIVGVIVGGAVSFVALLLVLYMIWIVSKRKFALRSTTQSNTELSFQPLVQEPLPVTTIATAGTPSLVDGSGRPVTVRSSMESVPPPYQPMEETHEEQPAPAEMNEAERGGVQKS